MNLQLESKLALVSGSTAGIGFAIAKTLAAEGARVIVNGRTDTRVNEAIASIHAKIPSAKLEGLALDLSKAHAAVEAGERFPNVAILVNNLGVDAPKPFEEITDLEWSSIIETNFMSGVRLSRYYLPQMKAANWGRILFISSESAVNIPAEMIHYGVTKTMQVALATCPNPSVWNVFWIWLTTGPLPPGSEQVKVTMTSSAVTCLIGACSEEKPSSAISAAISADADA